MSTTDEGSEPRASTSVDAAWLERELAAAGGTAVQAEFLLNPMAICKMVYRDGQPVDWLHLYVNPVWQRQSRAGPYPGKLASELFPGIQQRDPEVLQIFARVAAGGAPERFTRFLHSIGDWFDVQAYSPARGYLVAVFDVVSERIERERRVKEMEQRLSLAQSISRSGIWDWDIPTGELAWTPEMIRLLGLDPASTTPSFDTWRSRLHPQDIEVAEERINTAVHERTPLFNEYRVVWPDGQVRWLRAYGNTLYDDAGAPQRMLGLCVDVTDIKHLSQQAADAQAASLAKSTFLATMSHELRTPLNSIIGFATLLLERVPGEINDEQARQLAIVRRSGQQLLGLISEILDIARVESGRMTLELAPVRLRPLLCEQYEAARPLTAERGVVLHAPECDDALHVRADARRLSQVVCNLLGNAAKFTDEGSIRVTARAHDASVFIDVEDSGIGIAPEELQRIFIPFRRSDDPRSAARIGTGLGLSISRSLMLAMGGELTVDSQLGRGSTFRVTLPAVAEPAAPAD